MGQYSGLSVAKKIVWDWMDSDSSAGSTPPPDGAQMQWSAVDMTWSGTNMNWTA